MIATNCKEAAFGRHGMKMSTLDSQLKAPAVQEGRATDLFHRSMQVGILHKLALMGIHPEVAILFSLNHQSPTNVADHSKPSITPSKKKKQTPFSKTLLKTSKTNTTPDRASTTSIKQRNALLQKALRSIAGSIARALTSLREQIRQLFYHSFLVV